MNIDIRKSIKDNFKDSSNNDIIESIENAISDSDEITLPGMGVFFEILWNNSNENERNSIIEKIKKGL
jgi:small acid-soluble spore protein I (minor)